jgi:hypothetical protein
VFNYIDWTTITLKCWEKNGISDFYTDYSGNSTFIKAHRVTNSFQDLRINWENPFIFYDYDKDGLSEIALRYCDSRRPHPEAAELGFHHTQYDGGMTWFSIGIDMDNDNCPGNDFDFDMTLHYKAPNAVTYLEYVHPLKNMRGLPEADKFFPDARIRQLTELIYPDRNEAFDLAWRGKWEEARFCYDEDDDCGRWERVELYEDRDAFIQGTKKGGVDNHTQADPAGDRGEWDTDFSGGEQHVGIFKNVVAAINEGAPLLAPVAEGIKGLTISNAIHLSGWTGEVIETKNFPEDRFYDILQEKIRNSTVKKAESKVVADTAGTY